MTKFDDECPWIPLVKEALSQYSSYREAERYIGVSRNIVYFWIQGKCRPSVKEAYKLEEITNGKIKADDLLKGHPYYLEFEDLSDLLNNIFLSPLAKKFKNNHHRLDVLPPMITECINKNVIPGDDEIEILAALTQFPIKFWEGVQVQLQYKNNNKALLDVGWIKETE